MSLLVGISFALLGASALGVAIVLVRQAIKRVVARRLLVQAAELRVTLKQLRAASFEGLDKMLFEMRESYDPRVLEEELCDALEEVGGGAAPRLVRAFHLLGLPDRYLHELRESRRWRDRARAAAVLGELGDTRAVAPLVAAMRDIDEDGDVKLACAEALARIREPAIIPELCEQLGEVDEWASPRVAQVLTGFGAAAVEPLLSTLDGADSLNARTWAAQALGKIADLRATPALIERLHDRAEPMRLSAANALGDIGDGRAVRPLIDAILRDPVPTVRAQAASALGRIGDPGALPPLVVALGDPEHWMRFRALEAIEALAPDDVGPLEAALADSNPEVRKRAALALERLGRLEEPFAKLASSDDARAEAARARLIVVGRAGLSERIIRYLDDEDPVMRARIAGIIGAIGEPRLAGALVRSLADPDEAVQREAVTALGHIASPSSAGALLPFLESADRTLRGAAADALARYPGEALEPLVADLDELAARPSDELRAAAVRVLTATPGHRAMTILTAALGDRYVDVRLVAARALGERRAHEAVDALAACLHDTDAQVRRAAADAVGAIGGERAIDHLLEAVEEADNDQRDSICATLAERGFDAIRPVLDVLLASEHTAARLAATWTLGKTGDPRAAPLLAHFLDEPAARVRAGAAGALGKIESEVAEQSLHRAVGERDPYVRAAAVNALGRTGGPGSLAAAASLLRDPDAFVRKRAAVSVGLLGGAEAARALADAPADLIEPAYLAIGFGLSGTADGLAHTTAALADSRLRDEVSRALGDEADTTRRRFWLEVRPRDGDALAGEGADRLAPAAMVAQFAEIAREAPDVAERRKAIAALAATEGAATATAAALADAARSDPDREVRLRAARGLARVVEEPAARAVLPGAAADPDPQVRQVAIEILGDIGTPDESAPVFVALRSERADVREAAERALASIYADRVNEFLDWMMGHHGGPSVVAGLRVLARLADVRALGLTRVLMQSADPQVRAGAAEVLASLRVADAYEALLGALSDPVERVRVTVVRELAVTSRAGVLERLEDAVSDPSPAVRRALANALGAGASGRALDVLDRLVRDPHPEVAAGAAVSLLGFSDSDGSARFRDRFPRLTPEAQRCARERARAAVERVGARVTGALEPEVRERAIRALGAIERGAHAGRLAAGLADPVEAVRVAAAEELAELGPARAREWLAPAADDPSSAVRVVARRALVRAIE